MVFALQAGSDAPLYQQISEGLRREIAGGNVIAGTRLPSSRLLARDLGVSRITVTTAYAELEADGVVESRAGAGTFVLPPWPLAAHHAPRAMSDACPAWQAGLRDRINAERDRMLCQVLAVRSPPTPSASPVGRVTPASCPPPSSAGP